MRMTLRQLQIFNEVCDLRSYSRAAEEMSLTQPAVSLQIRQLFDTYLEGDLQKGMATHSSFLAWRVPTTEESGRLQTMGSQRVGHN